MKYIATSILAAVTALMSSANAHIIMTSPAPFQFPNSGTQLDPLSSDGSNFPCKMGSNAPYVISNGRTSMAAGSTQTLRFQGSAVHGGGSCQISLTRDLEPRPNSAWNVIHSIEGGCVARNTPGNLPDSTRDTYDFRIPSNIAPGQYTLAWTWFNKVGNPEMYMNCAPITITGAAAAKRDVEARRQNFSPRQNTFPGMYIANVGSHGNGCSHGQWKGSHGETLNVQFPNGGSSIDYANGAGAPRGVPPCGRESATGL